MSCEPLTLFAGQSAGCAGLCGQPMAHGQPYTFTFSYTGLLQVQLCNAGVKTILEQDSNFTNVSSVTTVGGIFGSATLAISFTWGGQGNETAGQAGQEMQNTLNNSWTATGFGTSVIFKGAAIGVNTGVGCNAASNNPFDLSNVLPLLLIGGLIYFAWQAGWLVAIFEGGKRVIGRARGAAS